MNVDSVEPQLLALTPNRVVAYNLARARTLRGLTQEQAAERLEPYLGVRWSKATFSAAERSVGSERVREFTADDLVAFARAFELPALWFLLPPPGDATGRPTYVLAKDLGDGTAEADLPSFFLEVLFGAPDDKKMRELIDQRIKEALRHSGSRRTEAQTKTAQIAARVGREVVREGFQDLTGWTTNLRELAAYMEAVHEESLERLRSEGAS